MKKRYLIPLIASPFLILILIIFLFLLLFATTINEQNSNLENDSYVDEILFKPYYEEAGNIYQIPWQILAGYHQSHPIYQQHVKIANDLKNLDSPKIKPYKEIIIHAAMKYAVDPALIAAVIQQESDWNPNIKSSAGAVGLMQLMPSHCIEDGNVTVEKCYEPSINIDIGTKVLEGCISRYGKGNMNLFLACYNYGPGNVNNKIREIKGGSGQNLSLNEINDLIVPFLPSETKNYIKKVPQYYKQYKTGGSSSQLEQVRQWIMTEAKKIADARDKYIANPFACNPAKVGLTSNDLTQLNNTFKEEKWKIGQLVCGLADIVPKQTMVKTTVDIAISLAGTATGKFIWPLDEGRISSGFGWRTHPIKHTQEFHSGIDIAAPLGSPIKAIDGGKVIDAGTARGFGQWVVIQHNENLYSIYGHVTGIKVKAGDTVRQGQIIAQVGNEGESTGPHLHLEIRTNLNDKSSARNPLQYVKPPN